VGSDGAPHARRLVSGSAARRCRAWRPVAIGTARAARCACPPRGGGVVGLKVTAGRISTYGVLPLSFTLDTPGPIARSVETPRWISACLSGPDPRRPADAGVGAPPDPLPMLRRGVAGSRLATLPDQERLGVDAEVLAAYDASVKKLASLGAEIVRVARQPLSDTPPAPAHHRRRGVSLRRPPRGRHEPAATRTSARASRWAAHVRARLSDGAGRARGDRRAFVTALADVDALLTPTAQTAAIPIAKIDQSGTAAFFTRAGNYLGLCGLGRCERLHRRRPADIAPDPEPTRGRRRPRSASAGPTSRRASGRSGGRRNAS